MTDSPSPEPGEVLAGSIGFLLSKLGFLPGSRFAAVLEPLGINPVHFALLRIVDAVEARSQHALGEALGIPPSRMVVLVDDLEGRGFVERRRSRTDRRVNTLHLTSQGRRVFERALKAASMWEAELCSSLDEHERAELGRLLRRLAAGQDLPVGVHPAMAQQPPGDKSPD